MRFLTNYRAKFKKTKAIMDSASFDTIENCFHYLCVLPGELLPVHFVLNEV